MFTANKLIQYNTIQYNTIQYIINEYKSFAEITFFKIKIRLKMTLLNIYKIPVFQIGHETVQLLFRILFSQCNNLKNANFEAFLKLILNQWLRFNILQLILYIRNPAFPTANLK